MEHQSKTSDTETLKVSWNQQPSHNTNHNKTNNKTTTATNTVDSIHSRAIRPLADPAFSFSSVRPRSLEDERYLDKYIGSHLVHAELGYCGRVERVLWNRHHHTDWFVVYRPVQQSHHRLTDGETGNGKN